MAKTNLRYSDNPVEIGMVRYVSVTDGMESMTVGCHIVTVLEPSRLVWDPECQVWTTIYPYRVRPATAHEEMDYLALPRSRADTFRAVA